MKTPLNAEHLFEVLLKLIKPHISQHTGLVGIYTGGVWLARRLHSALALPGEPGVIDVSFYRDDYSEKGLHTRPMKTRIPFDVTQTDILLIDDVLYTGRTTRAAINELFDYGRPARIDLAVLVDRGGRELPIEPLFCARKLEEPLLPTQNLQLDCDDSGTLTLRLTDAQ